MKWIEALKVWNIMPGQNTNLWKVPKKNTPENAEVKELMGGKKAKEARAREEMAEELRAVPLKKKRAIKISAEPEEDFDKKHEEEILSRAKMTAQKAKLKAFLSDVMAKKRAKMSEEKVLTKGDYDKLLRAKQLEYERWTNQQEKARQERKTAMSSAESQALREKDKEFTKEINKLKKLRKEAPVDAVSEEDFPRFASAPPSVDVQKLYMYYSDKIRGGKETRTGKPTPTPVYELVQESPPRFKLAYDRWSGGPAPYQTPRTASYILRETFATETPGGEPYYGTRVSRGEQKGKTTEGYAQGLFPYKPSERELNWLRTGKYE